MLGASNEPSSVVVAVSRPSALASSFGSCFGVKPSDSTAIYILVVVMRSMTTKLSLPGESE